MPWQKKITKEQDIWQNEKVTLTIVPFAMFVLAAKRTDRITETGYVIIAYCWKTGMLTVL